MSHLRFNVLQISALCALAIATACSSNSASKEAAPDALRLLTIGGVEVKVELAIDQRTQARGLMYRESLPEDQGMLFISSQPKQMSFWMRNTSIPLDIGFFTADGTLREIYPLYPHDETSRKSIGSNFLYALEVNQGWFKRKGIKPGDRFDPATIVP